MIYYAPVARSRAALLIFENWEMGNKENYNSYTRSGGGSAKRIRAHEGCLGIRRRRRTRKTAKILGEPSSGFDPGVSEWGNPSLSTGRRRRMN